MKKLLSHFFSRNIECDKPQGTLCKGPQAILTITVELIRAFFLGPESLLKTQFFEKNGNNTKKKYCGLFFLVISSVTNIKGQFVRVRKVI